jgi:hypothetical protein
MSNTVTSPNMGLPIPVVSTDPGPDWAQNINAALSILDGHNHSAGSGVLITPAGIFINADLLFNSNNATLLRSVRFSPQNSTLSASSDIGCLYEVGPDLYYNDGLGNQIRITQSGSVTGSTGTITGLPSGTASASYSAGTFTFQSATAVAANIAAAAVTNSTGVAVQGTNTGLSAQAGFAGELISASGSAVSFTTSGQYGGDHLLALSAGDWNVSWSLTAQFQGAATTQITAFVGTATGNNTTGLSPLNNCLQAGPTGSNGSSMGIAQYQVSIASPTNYYLKTQAIYGSGTAATYNYYINARRMR